MSVLEPCIQALPYVPLVLGIFLSFRVLKITDLTADGSFVLGGGLFAKLWIEGLPYGFCIMGGLAGGFCVGLFLAYLQKRDRMPALVASIICVFMLHSFNLLVMGRPNIPLLLKPTPFHIMADRYEAASPLCFLGVMGMVVTLLLCVLQTRLGLLARAFGSNKALLLKRGYRPDLIRSLGLASSNTLYALSGIACVHVQKFADINMGMGVALMGIGAVMIGRHLFQRLSLVVEDRFKADRDVLACVFGLVIYFTLMFQLLSFGVDPLYLKLALGALLISTFLLPTKGGPDAFTC